RAQAEGLQLTGEGVLLQQLTKRLLESALEGEVTDHLGYDRHDPAGKNGGNSRNGTRSKTVLTEVGPVEIAVPRDRDGSFEPKIVKKSDTWGKKYPAIVRLWENAWEEFIPFLRFDTEIRRIVCTTNAIESVNARIRRAVKARGHFPNEQAALKCVYIAIMSLDPTGKGQARWTSRWKTALNAFDITFDGRLSAARY
ncbi:IS256 family transposase, partial [Streptomyces sp. NRRL S-1824]|uniref:IS256 family transposase n=1 Tax=Streptomyces sp. NRRL S-1824 TaxID=1463889 RepID=UPI0004CA76C5